ncbi:hypothetical protein CROQUDRAFT_653983 [Cronartium quercuum f. sp. fusiforme G11]|uniref:MYND-type domain-containing protein n=1 Tax=Cronartium quercuum f. sp. fusiforme G11 TaxID=708437 RepID=A0A9P6NRV1_9BASI|nr:hypothetical protein CROQUDRAFT_653983 [Cronartium quercuum f. sp. fusiforme G11]
MQKTLKQVSSFLTNSFDSSTFLLLFPTALAILFVYLNQKRIVRSPFDNQIKKDSLNDKCSNCFKIKSIKQLKSCSRCKTQNNLTIYFCDEKCQKENWKTHKFKCGNQNWIEPKPIQDHLPDGLSRIELEQKLGKWCEFNRHILIYSTIQALDLIKNPQNSKLNLFLVSINHQLPKQINSNQPIHQTFSLDQFSPINLLAFNKSNPGMKSALDEMEKIRQNIIIKGGLGVAMLLVRCGPVVQVIPVGLPSQDDLNSVKRDKEWKSKFEETIKSGIQLKPLEKPLSN